MFRYFISFLGGKYLVNPLGTGKLKAEKDGDNIFFRNKLSGDYQFANSDFTLLHNLEKSEERCTEVLFTIEKLCGMEYKPYWNGLFSPNEGKWNLSKCVVTFSVRTDDPYRKIVDYYSKEYNALEVLPTDTVAAKFDFNEQFEFKEIGGDTIQDQDGTWAVFLQERYWIDGDWNSQGKHAYLDVIFRLVTTRDFVNGFPPELDTWTLIDANYTTLKAKYAKVPDLYNFKPYVYRFKSDFEKYPDLKQIPCNTFFDSSKYVKAYNLNDGEGCFNIRKNIDDNRWVSLIWEFGTFYFDRNRKLLDVLFFLLGKLDPSLLPPKSSDLSDFFTAQTNYATGTANQVKDLLIAHKSDIVSSTSTEAATKGMVSLKAMLENLREMFQVYWFLDANGKFRIEHISYFESLGQTDFTIAKYARYLEGKEAYEYDKSKMPRFEKLVFSDTQTEDFAEGLIEYASPCVNYEEGQDMKERTVSLFTTDIENLLVNASGSRSGFVLISHEGGLITKEAGSITGILQNNAHLSAANLVMNYYDFNRVLISGLVNGNPRNFKSVLKTKKQVAFSVPGCCDLEPNPFFTYITNVGRKGSLLSSEVDLKTGMVTFEIVHEATGSGFASRARSHNDSFNQSFG